MKTLEDRLDQASIELRRGVASMPTRPPSELSRRLSQRRTLSVTSVLVLVLGSFAGTAWLLTGEPGSPVASGNVATEQTNSADSASTPPTTTAFPDVVYDTAAADLWKERVGVALRLIGLPGDVASSYETPIPFRQGGSVTAVVEDANGELFLVADLQGWAPGEYSSDAAWQREVGGSNLPGIPVAGGTLFVADTHPTIHTLTLVTEGGLLTVQVEKTSLVPLPKTSSLMSFVDSLAPGIGDVASAGS
jgi:hypothetical protein